ncbi:Aminotransferase [Venustampulla echinocandica]|uniref:Aminotransferase n=1 Tax=Venustampulla echinocandica TaxID=2656787 RepID=A0A370TEA8_9HELO|nr:Aminotransferase [Venustampulla echinocandica]RDL33027.1 Aminotransferase [Venustampulla echinocandica]
MPPPPTIHTAMHAHLTNRRANSCLRKLSLTPQASIDFSSNDFLSLTCFPVLKTAFLAELTNSPSFSLGSGGSRLLDGNSAYAEDLEREIAAFHGAQAALLFTSGFDANAGFFACVPQTGDVVLFDEFVHASVREGMKLSRAGSCVSFAHNSVGDLRAKIEGLRADERIRVGERNVFVAIESLYSMDGDLSPIEVILELVEALLPKGNGHVVVDEAHSNGIYGAQGRGIVSSLGLEDRIFARLHTFGKGLACNGAAMLCTPLTREYLINYARPLIYSTAMSFPSLAAIKVVYTLMTQGGTESRIIYLNQLIEHMYHQLTTLLPYTKHPLTGGQLLQLPNEIPRSPIFALLTPEPRGLAGYCQDGGFMVRAIVPPTVPKGTQRVRICLHAGNTFDDVERLVIRIKSWLEIRGNVGGGDEASVGFGKAVL